MSRVAAILGFLAACSPAVSPPSPPSTASRPSAIHDSSQAHLLLFPESNAESLLGRAVQRSADGSWTLADARGPRCDVSVTKEKAEFHASRAVDERSMTSVAGGYAKVVSLEANLGRESTADVDVVNTSILRAELGGVCGDLVVDTVFVGHGKRTFEPGAAPAVGTGRSRSGAMSWDDEQAYGVGVRENAKTAPLDLRVELPATMDEGTEVTARFEVKQPAWLVVYRIDASGRAAVLWPSSTEPEPEATPETPAVLPSDKERAQNVHVPAQLLEPGQPARETLVVYAFADQQDFDAMKPAAGSQSDDGAGYAAELTMRLQHLPMSQWSRAVVGYVVQPKKE
jgi:hypothetical protein